MTHLILTGTTGTTGAAVLAACISTTSIKRITVLSRRPIKQAEGVSKVTVHLHEDFRTYDQNLLEKLKGATACIWVLGTRPGQFSLAEDRTINVDYPVAAAKAFATLNNGGTFNFVYASGEGATRVPGWYSSTIGRTKGEAEKSLLSLIEGCPTLRIFQHETGLRR